MTDRDLVGGTNKFVKESGQFRLRCIGRRPIGSERASCCGPAPRLAHGELDRGRGWGLLGGTTAGRTRNCSVCR